MAGLSDEAGLVSAARWVVYTAVCLALETVVFLSECRDYLMGVSLHWGSLLSVEKHVVD